ncbi:MAG: hypothetical protein ACREXY_06255 [Gammaproteobacteria bacterium]
MPIKREKVRDGVLVAEKITLTSPATAAEGFAFFRELWPAAEDMIERQRSWAQSLLDSHNVSGSRAKYAEHVVACAKLAADAVQKNDARMAVVHTMNMMRSVWRVDVKAIEPEIVTGAKQRRGGDKGRAAKSEGLEERNKAWQTAADRIWAKHPTWGLSEVARKINPLQERTIRRRIKKPAK